MEIKEPGITRKDVLILDDDDFCKENVCIVTGCGTGIGRAVTVAAAVNGLTVAGLDINAEQGEKTVDTARALDGTDVAFIPTDLTDDVQVRAAVKRRPVWDRSGIWPISPGSSTLMLWKISPWKPMI